MTTILASPSLYHETPLLHECSELAAISHDSHFVVSGPFWGLERIERYLRGHQVYFQRLPVSTPFHSSLIDPAREPFLRSTRRVRPGSPPLPAFSCAAAGEIGSYTREHLWRAVRDPIRFGSTIGSLEAGLYPVYVDLGPSGTLSQLVKRILPKGDHRRALDILSPFGRDIERLDRMMEHITTGACW